METVKVQLTDEERKHNRERLAAMLLERVEQNKRDLIEDQKNPEIQAFFASLREMKRNKDAGLKCV